MQHKSHREKETRGKLTRHEAVGECEMKILQNKQPTSQTLVFNSFASR